MEMDYLVVRCISVDVNRRIYGDVWCESKHYLRSVGYDGFQHSIDNNLVDL